MIIDKTIKHVTIGNTDIQRIMHGGGILWETFKDTSNAPGPKKLIGGSSAAGFFGEVSAYSFITGDELARRIGLTAGTSQFSNEPWLKFAYLGKIEFVAKKPFRHSISWDQINEANAVFGNKTININGNIYKVRLIKGKTEGKQDDLTSYEGIINRNSEWNKLILPIHQKAPSNWAYPINVDSPTENWGISYTDLDLITTNNSGNGNWTWCQEYGARNDIYRLYRGRYDVSFSSGYASHVRGMKEFGWRPVLELVN